MNPPKRHARLRAERPENHGFWGVFLYHSNLSQDPDPHLTHTGEDTESMNIFPRGFAYGVVICKQRSLGYQSVLADLHMTGAEKL